MQIRYKRMITTPPNKLAPSTSCKIDFFDIDSRRR
jgi:hypothetical protein